MVSVCPLLSAFYGYLCCLCPLKAALAAYYYINGVSEEKAIHPGRAHCSANSTMRTLVMQPAEQLQAVARTTATVACRLHSAC